MQVAAGAAFHTSSATDGRYDTGLMYAMWIQKSEYLKTWQPAERSPCSDKSKPELLFSFKELSFSGLQRWERFEWWLSQVIISTENLLLSFTSFFPLTSHHYLFFYLFLTSSEDSCWHRKPTEAVKTGKLEIAPYCFVAVLCSFFIRFSFCFHLILHSSKY